MDKILFKKDAGRTQVRCLFPYQSEVVAVCRLRPNLDNPPFLSIGQKDKKINGFTCYPYHEELMKDSHILELIQDFTAKLAKKYQGVSNKVWVDEELVGESMEEIDNVIKIKNLLKIKK
jgi:hypothetical protein